MISNQGDSKKLLILAFVYLLLSLFFIAYSSSNPEIAQSGSGFLTILARPIQSTIKGVKDTGKSILDTYINLINVSEENKKLKERLSILQSRNSRLQEARFQNRRLKLLLKMKENFKLEGIAAKVIGYDPNYWSKEILIDRGENSGLKVGQAVIETNGVVGQIIAVNSFSSRVLLISDLSSGVDAVVQATRVRGIVEGDGRLAGKWKFVLAEDFVQLGDRIVTSGLDGVFPAGIPIGLVKDVQEEKGLLFKDIKVEPFVNFSKLEEVVVLSEVEIVSSALPFSNTSQEQNQKSLLNNVEAKK